MHNLNKPKKTGDQVSVQKSINHEKQDPCETPVDEFRDKTSDKISTVQNHKILTKEDLQQQLASAKKKLIGTITTKTLREVGQIVEKNGKKTLLIDLSNTDLSQLVGFKDAINELFEEIEKKDSEISTVNLNLQGIIAAGVDWSGIKLNETRLNGAQLNRAYLDGAQFNGAQMKWIQMNNAHLNGTKFNGAQMHKAELNMAKLERAQFNGAQLNGSKFNGAQMHRAELNGAKLKGAQFNGAHLDESRLNWTDLNKAQLNWTQLNDAQLNGAKMNETELRDALMHRAQLIEAELNGSDLHGAQLNEAELFGAQLDNVHLANVQGITIKQLAETKILTPRSTDIETWKTVKHARDIQNQRYEENEIRFVGNECAPIR